MRFERALWAVTLNLEKKVRERTYSQTWCSGRFPNDSEALNIIIERVAESKSAMYNRKRAGTIAGDIAAEYVVEILREREGM